MGNKTGKPTAITSQEETYSDETCFHGQQPAKLKKQLLNELPHNIIGAIIFENKKGILGMGTGILISPDLVLTAAHNFYSHPTPKLPAQYHQKFRFYVGQYGPLQTYAQGLKWYFPQKFIAKNTPATDYALLRLAKPLLITTFAPLAVVDSIGKNERIGIFGYMREKNETIDPYDPYKMDLYQWGLTGSREMVERFRPDKGDILHSLSTYPGQSGAPFLLISQDRSCKIIGIHKGGVKLEEKFFNISRHLTTALIKELKEESEKLGAIPFKTTEGGKEEVKSPAKDIKEEKTGEHALLKEGRALIQQKMWKEAAELFERVLTDEPDSEEALLGRGRAVLENKWYAKAEQVCRKAVEKKKNSAEAHSNLGWALWRVNKYQEGIKSCQAALTIDPNFSAAHNYMGNNLNDLGRKEEAIQCFKKALAIDPNYSAALYNMGNTFDDLKRREEAIQCFKKALAIDPKDLATHYNMGISLSALGRKKEAIESYKKALAIDPNISDAHYNMGISLAALGRKEEAILSYRRAIEINPYRYFYYNNLLIVLAATDKQDEGVNFLMKVKAEHPECKQVRQALQRLLEK